MKLPMTHSVQRILLLCSICWLLPGCSTPQYLMPGGYSSTYQKALIGDSILMQQSNLPAPVVQQQANTKTETLR